MNDRLLMIFARNPILGEVKSRLATAWGEPEALRIYKRLLLYTISLCQGLSCTKWLWYSGGIPKMSSFRPQGYRLCLQQGDTLGERLYSAFTHAARAYRSVIVIGSDCYALRPTHIHEAWTKLSSNDVVIGPAKDGGYYLLGVQHPHTALLRALFYNKHWSTPALFTQTLQSLRAYSVDTLSVLPDIDNPQDVPKEWQPPL